MHRAVRTPTLEIAYEQTGPEDGDPVILLHGFPYDVRGWDGCVNLLAQTGCRVIVPWLRGYGPTRFLDPSNAAIGPAGGAGGGPAGAARRARAPVRDARRL